jgi:hypothetical protein
MWNMERGQGRRFSQEKIEKIKHLLATTDLSIPEIAQRMNCSGGPINAINKKFKIRLYENRRLYWVLNTSSEGAGDRNGAGL